MASRPYNIENERARLVRLHGWDGCRDIEFGPHPCDRKRRGTWCKDESHASGKFVFVPSLLNGGGYVKSVIYRPCDWD